MAVVNCDQVIHDYASVWKDCLRVCICQTFAHNHHHFVVSARPITGAA
jgi:hypothetical protein